MLAEAREQAIDRRVEGAQARDAEAVVVVRFQTSEINQGAAEGLRYGTAVTLEALGWSRDRGRAPSSR